MYSNSNFYLKLIVKIKVNLGKKYLALYVRPRGLQDVLQKEEDANWCSSEEITLKTRDQIVHFRRNKKYFCIDRLHAVLETDLSKFVPSK